MLRKLRLDFIADHSLILRKPMRHSPLTPISDRTCAITGWITGCNRAQPLQFLAWVRAFLLLQLRLIGFCRLVHGPWTWTSIHTTVLPYSTIAGYAPTNLSSSLFPMPPNLDGLLINSALGDKPGRFLDVEVAQMMGRYARRRWTQPIENPRVRAAAVTVPDHRPSRTWR